jgi:hypothetical protein
MTTPAPWQTEMEIKVNQAVSGLGMVSNPSLQAEIAGQMIRFLQGRLKQIVEQRQAAIAKLLLQPGMSMAKLATELGLSKSYVGKLAPLEVRQRVADEMEGKRMEGERVHWANGLRNWGPMNTAGLGDERVQYLIAGVSGVPGNQQGEWLVQVHDYKKSEAVELERRFCQTEVEARVEGILIVLRRNEDGLLNGTSDRRHYAHRGVNACGTPVSDQRDSRNDPITCIDCLVSLGLLGA